jgi:hypothetical protein
MNSILVMTLILSAIAVIFLTSRAYLTLYALAVVVSLVGINIHLGVTINLTRIVIFFFYISIILKMAAGKIYHLPLNFLSPFVTLFSLTLFVQFISTILSDHALDGLRQIAIYISLMVLFITINIIGVNVRVITKAVYIYLFIGLVQGLYGMYQVIGGPFSWPTYQTLMEGIPTTNDRTVNGYYYTGAYQSFRPTGFFPADVSHYSGYMVGILIISLALLAYNRRSLFLSAVLVSGIMGLLFSLSRSGILTFILFGIPILLFLLWRLKPLKHWSISMFVAPVLPLVLMVVLGVLAAPVIGALGIDLTSTLDNIYTRMIDLVNAGGNENESMSIHILSRALGLDAWLSSPIIGVGLGVNASPWFSQNYQDYWTGSHSHHLDILGQTGLLGAILEWSFMWLVARYMWRGLFVANHYCQEQYLLAGLLASFIAIILGNLLYHYYINQFAWFLMGCGVALSRSIILDARKSTFVRPFDVGISSNKNIIGPTNIS